MDIKVNQERLSAYFSLSPLRQTQQTEMYKQEDASYGQPNFPVVNENYIFGVEVEVENCRIREIKARYLSYWDTVVDNSLRNNGIEFVSKPLKARQLEGALTQLNQNLAPTVDFSPRTSTHVHMNARDLSINQILNLVILYTATENLLFNWVGHGRDNNIFCIKLTETNYARTFLQLQKDPNMAVRYWNKYTALNLAPLSSKGTVEFRHLYGTADPKIILQWVRFISRLKETAKSITTIELLEKVAILNTNSYYEEFVRDIFKEDAEILLGGPFSLQDLLEDSISYLKLCTLQVPKPDEELPERVQENEVEIETRTPADIPRPPEPTPLPIRTNQVRAEYTVLPELTPNDMDRIRATQELMRAQMAQYRNTQRGVTPTTTSPFGTR